MFLINWGEEGMSIQCRRMNVRKHELQKFGTDVLYGGVGGSGGWGHSDDFSSWNIINAL